MIKKLNFKMLIYNLTLVALKVFLKILEFGKAFYHINKVISITSCILIYSKLLILKIP